MLGGDIKSIIPNLYPQHIYIYIYPRSKKQETRKKENNRSNRDSFTKREKASEDYYIRQKERQKLVCSPSPPSPAIYIYIYIYI